MALFDGAVVLCGILIIGSDTECYLNNMGQCSKSLAIFLKGMHLSRENSLDTLES